MGWIYLPSVSIQNGSNIVTVNNTATDSIKPGDGLLIGSYDLVEIIEVSIGQLKLKKNWSSANQSNAEAAVVPTFGDFNAATAALRQATTITQGNFAEMEKWWTQLGQVKFKAYNNTEHTVRTAKQMEQDVSALEAQANALIAEIAGAGYARSESDMMADRERNNQLYAASAPIHMGKHAISSGLQNVNEGLYVFPASKNTIYMGRQHTDKKGASATDSAVFNFAGVTATMLKEVGAVDCFNFKLPDAPKGTEVYDSTTGVLTNFETDVDPKYGDVAPDTNEAVARAFEGMVKNGDFRLGNTYWSSADGRGTMSIQDGKCTLTDSTGLSLGGLAMWATVEGTAFVNGETYVVEIFVESLTNLADGWVRLGYYTDPNEQKKRLVVGLNRFEFTAGTTNANQGVLIYAGNNGTMVFSSFYVRKKSAEVVISPVDLVGLEVFLRPITASDPFVYPYGIQQSKLTSVDGIATVENNVRPITHFEVYPGDTASRGRGWNLLDGSLSDAQKAKVFQNPKHNIYRMNDGTLAQWTVSGRSFRGAGNDDWNNITLGTYLRFGGVTGNTKYDSYVLPRGNLDSRPPFSVSNNYADTFVGGKEVGLFRNNVLNPGYGYNGECYFYVIATVPRLNQGAYHPFLNPNGAAAFINKSGQVLSRNWYNTDYEILTTSDCFRRAKLNASGGAYGGDIVSTAVWAGHPDSKFYESIYDSGLNGIIDHRPKYGAWDASTAEQAEVVRKEVKNGTYRGREKLVFTHVQTGTQSSTAASTNAFTVDDVSKFVVGDLVSIVSGDVIIAKERVVTSIGSSNITFNGEGVPRDVESYYFFVTTKTNLTVEGAFLQVDVLGHPANILQCLALKNGWPGGWIAIIPDGTTQDCQLTRKSLKTTLDRLFTSNFGQTWAVNNNLDVDAITSSRPEAWRAEQIAIYSYTASAKPTEKSASLPVFNGNSGLLGVTVTNIYSTSEGSLLNESALGIISKNNNYPAMNNLSLLSTSLKPSNSLLGQGGDAYGYDAHAGISLASPANNSHAGKFLFYQINESGQANLNIVANELIYSSTASNWGDDSKVKVLADSTFTDLNGNKCKAAIHKLAKPYGFIKNKI